MAALDRKDFKLKLENVNVNDMVEKAIENVALQVQKRNGTISSKLKADPAVVTGDAVHLTNIIQNLLDNANKYSPEEPEILVETFNDKDGVVITVEDHGLGMSKESVQKIFDRFYRVPTGNVHDVKGFGLGLAYVKTMVEAHGGTIAVKSELKKGSTFEIHIPYGNQA
jgi:two-component system, OmpR family, phosphate regulon sensor histidine kinase PhoR